MTEKTCVACHYGKRDDFGDLICVNAKSNNCSDWVCENDTCDCWQKRIVTNFERITASPAALATGVTDKVFECLHSAGVIPPDGAKLLMVLLLTDWLNSEADK